MSKDTFCGEDKGLTDYDETNYPANADSDTEEDEKVKNNECNSSTVKSCDQSQVWEGSKLPLSEDVSCAVCAEVFVEPCTLHCGHSFCQLCLSAVWKSSRHKSPMQLHCPVCRQPWVNFPGVNIQLRNIVEKSHGELVNYRRANFCDVDKSTLAQFKKAIEGDWKRERHETRRPYPRPLILGLLFIGLLVIALVTMTTVVILSVVIPEGDMGFIQKPVSEWNNDDVMAWLGGLGDWASHNISKVFSKEKITGAQLKLLDLTTLKNLGITGDSFTIQSLLLAIEKLKENDYTYPRNFDEFMAAHRKETILTAIMYKFWPRFTFLYIYLFEYEAVFVPVWQYSIQQAEPVSEPSNQQLVLFGVEILLVPHYVAGLFAWQWISVHPWLCIAVMIHCVWATQNEAKRFVAQVFAVTQVNWRQKFWQTLRDCTKDLFKFAVVMGGGFFVWPVVPHFLCTLMFYVAVWSTLVHLLFKPLKLFTVRRQRRRQRIVANNNIVAQLPAGAGV